MKAVDESARRRIRRIEGEIGQDRVHRAARARHCRHTFAADTDPLAVSWPREIVCLNCGVPVDPGVYVVDPRTALRRRAEGSAAR